MRPWPAVPNGQTPAGSNRQSRRKKTDDYARAHKAAQARRDHCPGIEAGWFFFATKRLSDVKTVDADLHPFRFRTPLVPDTVAALNPHCSGLCGGLRG